MFVYSGKNDLQEVSHCAIPHVSANVYGTAHLHDGFELLLFIRGDVNYSIDGERYALRPYDLLFIPSATYHFLIPISDGPYENYVINFSSSFLSEERLNKLFAPPYIVNISEDSKMKALFGAFAESPYAVKAVLYTALGTSFSTRW